MSQVRLVQIGVATSGTNIQLGHIGATLGATPAVAGNPVQLGKFNNTTGTFYRDPSNPSGGTPGQQIQIGTNLAARTLGYIVGSGAPTVTAIASSGYFSIWNNAVVQGAFQIQTPSGNQAKPSGSQVNNHQRTTQTINNDTTTQVNHQRLIQQTINNDTTTQVNHQRLFQQTINNDTKNHQRTTGANSDAQVNHQRTLGANSDAQVNHQRTAGLNNDTYLNTVQFHDHIGHDMYNINYDQVRTTTATSITHYGYNDTVVYNVPYNYDVNAQQDYHHQHFTNTQNNHQRTLQTINNDTKNHQRTTGSNNDTKNHQRIAGANSDAQVNHQRTYQVPNNDTKTQVNHQRTYQVPTNDTVTQVNHQRTTGINNDTKTPQVAQAAQGTLYNGYWVNTQPGAQAQPGSETGSTILLSIGNIGTLTTVGGSFQSTGPATGQYQTSATTFLQNQLAAAPTAAFQTQQGVILFQGTTHN